MFFMTRNHLDWILGFGAHEINARKLLFRLPKFVELVFLREADQHGHLQVFPSSIRHSTPGKSRFLESVQDTMCFQHVLTNTSVIAMSRPHGFQMPLIRELVFSSQMSMWGIPLPDCPTCGNHQVRANQRKIMDGKAKRKEDVVTVKCHGCGSTTKGKGVRCPQDVEEIRGSGTEDVRYYWKQLHVKSPWEGHSWRGQGHDLDC